jgi:hypothetical protein
MKPTTTKYLRFASPPPYPHVVQFETRRRDLERELALRRHIREAGGEKRATGAAALRSLRALLMGR